MKRAVQTEIVLFLESLEENERDVVLFALLCFLDSKDSACCW